MGAENQKGTGEAISISPHKNQNGNQAKHIAHILVQNLADANRQSIQSQKQTEPLKKIKKVKKEGNYTCSH